MFKSMFKSMFNQHDQEKNLHNYSDHKHTFKDHQRLHKAKIPDGKPNANQPCKVESYT